MILGCGSTRSCSRQYEEAISHQHRMNVSQESLRVVMNLILWCLIEEARTKNGIPCSVFQGDSRLRLSPIDIPISRCCAHTEYAEGSSGVCT